MILPSKHIKLSESLIGLGAFVVSIVKKPLTIDECWKQLNEDYINTGKLKKHHSFDNFILTVDLLYMIGVIEMNSKGEIYNVSSEIVQ